MISPSAVVSIRDVTFAYRRGAAQSLAGASIDVAQGEVLLVTGASGSGKTTLTRLANGLVPHFYEDCELAGQVRVAGMVPADVELHELAPVVGSVFQSPKTQFFCLDTTEELAFSCENLGVAPEDILQRIDRVARDFNVRDLLGRNPFDLSGGEAQRVACGSASMLGPQVMVLDEPSSNLDAESVWRLRDIIARWRADGCTIVISEHRLHYLEGLVDRVAFMRDGRVERVFGGAEFYALAPSQLHAMGLRAARWEQTLGAQWLGEGKPCGSVRVCDLRFSYDRGRKRRGRAQDAQDLLDARAARGTPEALDVPGAEDASSRRSAPANRGARDVHVPSLDLQRGCVTAVIGPNGAGKSTLARCLCGLARPESGTIDAGHGPEKLGRRARHGFLVMQNVSHQLFRESVLAEVLEAQPAPDEAAARAILEALDLASYAEAHPLALSGGQQQRVAIATAIASQRSLLVLDEPTSGLDLLHMRQVARAVGQAAAQGRAVMVITHDLEFVQACCTHFALMCEGRVVQAGPLDAQGRALVLDFFDKTRG